MSTETNEIDHKYGQILSRLENYKVSHPTIYKLWKEYLRLQHEQLNKIMNDCDNAMNNMETIGDCDINTVRLLYYIMRLEQST